MLRIRKGKVVLAIAVLTGMIAAIPMAFVAVGHWLIVADPLQPARAIVVFGGQLPFRAMEAAAIFQQGFAPEIWLTHGALHKEDAALAQLGIQVIPECEYNRQVLEHLGIPGASIKVLDTRVEDTAEEVKTIGKELRRVGGTRVILVTSKYHTRRVRLLWHKLIGDSPQAIVRYAQDDPFDPDRWWRSSHQSPTVAHEVFGILNAWLGFPLHP